MHKAGLISVLEVAAGSVLYISDTIKEKEGNHNDY